MRDATEYKINQYLSQTELENEHRERIFRHFEKKVMNTCISNVLGTYTSIDDFCNANRQWLIEQKWKDHWSWLYKQVQVLIQFDQKLTDHLKLLIHMTKCLSDVDKPDALFSLEGRIVEGGVQPEEVYYIVQSWFDLTSFLMFEEGTRPIQVGKFTAKYLLEDPSNPAVGFPKEKVNEINTILDRFECYPQIYSDEQLRATRSIEVCIQFPDMAESGKIRDTFVNVLDSVNYLFNVVALLN